MHKKIEELEKQAAIYEHALEALKKMQQFKELLFKLLSIFIHLPADEIDKEIEKGLKEIGKFWGFDRITLAQFSEEHKSVIITHTYVAKGVPDLALNSIDSIVPWLMEKLSLGDEICLNNLPEDLPVDATIDREHFIKHRVKSVCAIPFKVEESIRGGLFFASIHKKHVWTYELVQELKYFAEIISNTLEHKKVILQLGEQIKFEHLLAEISAAYINLPAKEIENSIRTNLGRLGRFLKADRCVLYLAAESKHVFEFSPLLTWWNEDDTEFYNEVTKWAYDTKVLENNVYKDFQYSFDKWSRGEHLQVTTLDDLPSEASKQKAVYQKFGIKSFISIPIVVAGSPVGALVVLTTHTHRTWPENLVSRIRLVGEIFGNAIARKKAEGNLQNALAEIKKLKEQLEAEVIYLTEEINLDHNFHEIIGNSDALKNVLHMTKQVAPTNSTVLISGETGTGKELIARAIHSASKRKDRALIKINCAALSPTLIESELFGHEKGAYTGAGDRRKGRFELADGATLFLDEIGELPLELQPKLLRFLQEGEFERVGGSHTIKTDVRVIAATNRNLETEIEKGRFRQDLWYRLNIFPIHIPPLRKHPEDIPWLARWFITKYSKKIGKRFDKIPQKTVAALQNHQWPGNIRELENLIERAVITSPENRFHIETPETAKTNTAEKRTMEDVERNHIVAILNETNWKIEGTGGAAGVLGLKPSTLRNRMKKLEIRR